MNSLHAKRIIIVQNISKYTINYLNTKNNPKSLYFDIYTTTVSIKLIFIAVYVPKYQNTAQL